MLNSKIRNNNIHDNKRTSILSTYNYQYKQQQPPSLSQPSPIQRFHKTNQAKMLIMPLAILLLSSTVVMATSNSILPPAAYAITFGSTKNLSDNAGDSFDPRIEASGNNVYTVWNDRSGGDPDTFPNTFFKRSATSGDSFDSTKDLSNGIDGFAQEQHIAKEGNNVYVVWVEGAGPHDVYFKRSTNGGASFESTINLSNDDNGSAHPDIAVDGDNVYVVWVSTIAEDQEQLFFKRSTNDGASFGSVKKLNIQFEELNPRIAAAGNNVYIAFIGGSYRP